MRRIEKAFGGHAFALAVFLAVYAGLLAIVLTPREGSSAHLDATGHGFFESAVIASK